MVTTWHHKATITRDFGNFSVNPKIKFPKYSQSKMRIPQPSNPIKP